MRRSVNGPVGRNYILLLMHVEEMKKKVVEAVVEVKNKV